MMPPQLWVFRARVTRVIDGDTVDATVDAAFHSSRIERLRLLGVNAPERKLETRAAGDAAKQFVEDWLVAAGLGVGPGGDWPLIIQTEKTDVFGRYLANIWRVVDGANLSDDLLTSGNAVVFPALKA